NIIEQRARAGAEGDTHVWNATSMFDVARALGDALREVKARDGPYMEQHNIDSSANFIVGGQIHDEAPRLFEVYSEGNFIEATPDTCYFQIGESKDGKPVIDRVVHRGTSRVDATKCTIVALDSRCVPTSRSGCRSTCWCTRPGASRWPCSAATRNSTRTSRWGTPRVSQVCIAGSG